MQHLKTEGEHQFSGKPFQQQNSNRIRCDFCKRFAHVTSHCTLKKYSNTAQVRTVSYHRSSRGRRRGNTRYAAVNRVIAQDDVKPETEIRETKRVTIIPCDGQLSPVGHTCDGRDVVNPVCDLGGREAIVQHPANDQQLLSSPVAVSANSIKLVPQVKTPFTVLFKNGNKQSSVLSLHDTGAQLSVLSKSHVPESVLENSSPIKLQGAFFTPVEARLCNIQARLDVETSLPVTLTVAVTSELKGDVALIRTSDHQLLKSVESARLQLNTFQTRRIFILILRCWNKTI